MHPVPVVPIVVRLEAAWDDGSMSERTPGRYALLVGAGRYDDDRLSPLPSAAADVAALAEVLGDPELGGFAIETLLDESSRMVHVAVERLVQKARRDDVALIYYSGRGVKDLDGRLYLALRDTEVEHLRATGLSSTFLLESLASRGSRAKVLILDAAFSGAVISGGRVPDGAIILTSASALGYAWDSVAEETVEGPGVFTRPLVEGLRSGDADLDGDGIVTFEELFGYVRSRVAELVPQQNPRLFNLTETPIRASLSPKYVFVSYSRVDSEFVEWLNSELRASGVRTWIDDRSISGGDEWRAQIVSAIESAKAVIVVVSPDALAATWVRRELEYADQIGKPVIPILARPTQLPSWFTITFGGLQRVEVLDEGSRAEAVGRLREAIGKRMRSAHATPHADRS
jgi:hypothetical protein